MDKILGLFGAVPFLAGIVGALVKLRRWVWSENLKRRLIREWPHLNAAEREEIGRIVGWPPAAQKG